MTEADALASGRSGATGGVEEQDKLTRLISADSSAWQAKGYLHEGLNTRWPLPEHPHHNPGHTSRWMRVDD